MNDGLTTPTPEGTEPAMTGWCVPRLMGFFRDVEDAADGVVAEAHPVAWGMREPDGSVGTCTVGRPRKWTVYQSIEDASVDLDAWPCPIDQHHLVWRGHELVWMPAPGGDTASAAGRRGQGG